jgi:hypothetical protein
MFPFSFFFCDYVRKKIILNIIKILRFPTNTLNITFHKKKFFIALTFLMNLKGFISFMNLKGHIVLRVFIAF